ncbi:MAG: 30S ribosomal protein S14 [Pseudomonadota bacterium]
MSSQRMIRRETKRTRLVANRKKLRAELVLDLKNPKLGVEKKYQILAQLEKLPRDSSSVRRTRRCALTGNAHGVYRKFGLGRHKLRQLALEGCIPGLVMASW